MAYDDDFDRSNHHLRQTGLYCTSYSSEQFNFGLCRSVISVLQFSWRRLSCFISKCNLTNNYSKTSKGWLHRFKNCYDFRQLTMQGESLSANTSAADFKLSLRKVILCIRCLMQMKLVPISTKPLLMVQRRL